MISQGLLDLAQPLPQEHFGLGLRDRFVIMRVVANVDK